MPLNESKSRLLQGMFVEMAMHLNGVRPIRLSSFKSYTYFVFPFRYDTIQVQWLEQNTQHGADISMERTIGRCIERTDIEQPHQFEFIISAFSALFYARNIFTVCKNHLQIQLTHFKSIHYVPEMVHYQFDEKELKVKY